MTHVLPPEEFADQVDDGHIDAIRAVVISNPNSTSITSRSLRSVIPTLLRLRHVRLRSHFTTHAGHAETLAREATAEGHDVIIAIGGDGTVNEVLNGVLSDAEGNPTPGPHPLIGIIPTGSANVFARAAGFSSHPARAAGELVEAIESRSVKRIGLGQWRVDADTADTLDADEAERDQTTSDFLGDDSLSLADAGIASPTPGQPDPTASAMDPGGDAGWSQWRWFAVNAGFGIDADVIEAMESDRSSGGSATPLHYIRIAVVQWMRTLANPPKIKVTAQDKAGERSTREDLPLAFVSHTDPWSYLGPLPARWADRGLAANPPAGPASARGLPGRLASLTRLGRRGRRAELAQQARESLTSGLTVFAIPRLVGAMPTMAMLGLISPLLRQATRSFSMTWYDADVVTLDVNRRRAFQIDGESKGIHAAAQLRFVPNAATIIVPAGTAEAPGAAQGQAAT